MNNNLEPYEDKQPGSMSWIDIWGQAVSRPTVESFEEIVREGGASTGTHIHLARKFNGEWMPAEGLLGYNLEGWTAHNGSQPYLGTMTRGSQTVTACTCSNAASFMKSDRPVPEKVMGGNN